MSIAEVQDTSIARRPLVPPSPPPAPEGISFFGRMTAMRKSVITARINIVWFKQKLNEF
jgi:hypothetical protein